MSVRWDPESGRLAASQRIAWTNHSGAPLGALRLLHPWKALGSPSGPWWRSARALGLRLPHPDAAPEVSVKALRGPEGVDWLARLEEVHEPGSGVYSLVLPRALGAGETLTFELETESRLETIVGRTGRLGDFLAAAGWLVRVAPFDPRRHARGEHPWFDEPAHALVEPQVEHFDARWSASLPSRYAGRIAATGTPAKERVEAGRVHVGWDAPRVVELALFADPRFVVADAREVPSMVARAGPLPRVFLQPEHRDLARRALDETFRIAGELAQLGGRSIERVALVDPPRRARGVSGMEYPGVVTVRLRASWSGLSIETRRLLRHELAHQVFYAEVASDTVGEPFLEEGLATLLEMRTAPHEEGVALGPWYAGSEALFRDPGGSREHLPWRLLLDGRLLGAGATRPLRAAVEAAPITWMRLAHSGADVQRVRWLPHAGKARVRQPGREYESREQLDAHAYALAALSLRQILLEQGLREDDALSAFVEAFRGRRASSDDLVRTLAALPGVDAEVLAASVSRYWDSAGWVDAAAVELSCEPVEGEPRCRARFEHRGPWRPRLEVWLDAEGQGARSYEWPAGQAELTIEAPRGSRILSAGVELSALDVDYSNNARRLEASGPSQRLFLVAAWRQLVMRLCGMGRLP